MSDEKKTSRRGQPEQQPSRRNDVIRCERCGEDYSVTYKRCPFCDERPGRTGITGKRVKEYGGPANPIQIVGLVLSLVVIVAALGLLRMTERSRMGADAAIAVVSASSLAVGVIVTSLTTGMTTDVDSYMFGSILAMDRSDVALSAGLSAAVLLLFVLFYHKLFAITFDESFSRATGVRVGLYNTFLSVLTALTIVHTVKHTVFPG